MILEGIVTTRNADGSPNIAPMGPVVDRELMRVRLRPFASSRTWRNLSQSPYAVLHVTDDVELFARAAIDVWERPPLTVQCGEWGVERLVDCCRWLALHVERTDSRQERIEVDCAILARGTVRDFFGFNRAKHAVIEAAILATRLGIVADTTIQQEFERLAVIVQKTAGDQETRAFDLLREFVNATGSRRR